MAPLVSEDLDFEASLDFDTESETDLSDDLLASSEWECEFDLVSSELK